MFFKQVGNDLGIGFRNKPVAFLFQAGLQRSVIGNDAVVNDGKFLVARCKGWVLFFVTFPCVAQRV